MQQASKKSTFSKYRTIIVLVVVFLLFDAVILAFNYYFSGKIAQDTVAINLAARQGILTQKMAKEVMDIDVYTLNTKLARQDGSGTGTFAEEMDDTITQLKKSRDMFSSTLEAFAQSGKISTEGREIYLEVNTKEGKQSVKDAQELWQPYERLIDSFLASVKNNKVNPGTIGFAVDYARTFNGYLFFQTNKLTTSLEREVSKKTKILQYVQAGGITVAIILFFLIVFYALRQLAKSDEKLEEARRETIQILATVNEGLFLIDPDLTIGQEYSGQLETIIKQKDIAGKKLTEILEPILSEHDALVLRTFVKQLYNNRVVEDLIRDLNPLQRVNVILNDENNKSVSRYLDFKFSRVYQGDEIERALVSVSDVTEAVTLEERLAQEREQNDLHIQMLSLILNADHKIMRGFIESGQQRITQINDVLRSGDKDSESMEDKLRRIYREIHSLKGEASAMKLASYVGLCETFEEKIKDLQNQNNLAGNDFLPLTMLLDEVMDLHHFIETLSNKVSSLTDKTISSPSKAEDSAAKIAEKNRAIRKYYADFVTSIAARHHKQVSLTCNGMNDAALTEEQQKLIKEISLQLLRNAVVHGIETPQEREAAGKTAGGHVQLLLVRNSENNSADLIIEDNGDGINFEKIRVKALESGKYDTEAVQAWDRKQLFGLILDAGFSTADTQGEDAGRGVGMDVVKDRIQQLGGKLKAATESGQYTRFTINFPL